MGKSTESSETLEVIRKPVHEAADQPTTTEEPNSNNLNLPPPYKATADEIVASIAVGLLCSPLYGYFLYFIINGGTMSGRRMGNLRRGIEVDPFDPFLILIFLIGAFIQRRFLSVLACIPPRLFLFLLIKPGWHTTVWASKVVWKIAHRLSKTRFSVARLRTGCMVLHMVCTGLFKLFWMALGNPVGMLVIGLMLAISIYLMA